MAIKGKGRTKARPVARGPRPAYTAPPVPWFSRRWVQVMAAFVAGILAVALFAWVRGNLQQERADRADRQRQAAERTLLLHHQGRMDPILSQIGQAHPPLFVAFPALGQAIDDLQGGKTSPSKASDTASTTQSQAKKAAQSMDAVDTASILRPHPGLPGTFTRDVSTSKSAMSHAVAMYEQAAALLGLAADASGGDRDPLLASAKSLNSSADTLFADG